MYRLIELTDGGLTRTHVGDYTAQALLEPLLLSTSRLTILGQTYVVELA